MQRRLNAKIEEIAATYETPDEVREWYGKPENRAQVEAVVAEDGVVDFVLDQVKVKKKKMSYEDAVKAAGQQA